MIKLTFRVMPLLQASVDGLTDWLGLPRGERLGRERLDDIWTRGSQCDISLIFTDIEQHALRRFYVRHNAGLVQVAGFDFDSARP